MIFQLTTAGKALLAANPTSTVVTSVQLGAGFDYVPATDPTGLIGSMVYVSSAVFQPSVVNVNTLRYTVLLPGASPAFTFGEVAFYVGSTLFGVGAQVLPVTKPFQANGDVRVDIYVSLIDGNVASFESVSSNNKDVLPRLISVDSLVPPTDTQNNVYSIYGDSSAGAAFLAYSDPSGIWTFSNKGHLWYSGVVTTVGSLGLQSNDLVGSIDSLTPDSLALQFTSGALRGYCRKTTNLTSDGAVQWQTPLAVLPAVGDSFIIVGESPSFDSDSISAELDAQQTAILQLSIQTTTLGTGLAASILRLQTELLDKLIDTSTSFTINS